MPIISPFVAVPPGAPLPQQSIPNAPALATFNSMPDNRAGVALQVPVGKSRRMRPTKSNTARYVLLVMPYPAQIYLLSYVETSVLSTGARKTRAHPRSLIYFGIICPSKKKRYVCAALLFLY